MKHKTANLDYLPRSRSPLQKSDCTSSTLSPLSLTPSAPSPNSSLTTTAPPRLNLRTLLPSPPQPQRFLPTPPTYPYPWIWKCHLCNSTYRLGVTRRCLEDGHFFCSVVRLPTTPIEEGEGEESEGDSTRRWELEREKRRRKRRDRKRGAKWCRSEFDYEGWSKYNIWRREVRAIKYGQKLDSDRRITEIRHRELLIGVEVTGARRQKHCWRDCDFPSECLDHRKVGRELVAQMEKMRELEEWFREREKERLRVDFETGVVEQEGMEVDVALYDAEEKGDESETLKSGKEHMGILGTDCDGLGEEVYQAEYAKCRRKNLDAVAESPPSSPLKSCSFGFEDVDIGCDFWAGENLQSDEEEEDTDAVQMEEVLMGKIMLLRKCRKGDEGGRFGDEEDDAEF